MKKSFKTAAESLMPLFGLGPRTAKSGTGFCNGSSARALVELYNAKYTKWLTLQKSTDLIFVNFIFNSGWIFCVCVGHIFSVRNNRVSGAQLHSWCAMSLRCSVAIHHIVGAKQEYYSASSEALSAIVKSCRMKRALLSSVLVGQVVKTLAAK